MLSIYITSCRKKEGKTFLSAGIAATMQSLGYKTSVYKPIQTCGIEKGGFTQSPDLTFVKTIDPYIETYATYIFKEDSEPLIASENENMFIDTSLVQKDYERIASQSECVVIDGDSGILSPIAPETSTADMVRNIQVPVLFNVTPDENSVNAILTAINSAEEKRVKINGVIVNKISDDVSSARVTSLIRIIEEYTNVRVLGLVPNLGGNIMPEELITGILNGIDIESVFDVKIEKLDFGR